MRYLPDNEVIAASITQVMLDFKNVVGTVKQLQLLTSEGLGSVCQECEQSARGSLSGKIMSSSV